MPVTRSDLQCSGVRVPRAARRTSWLHRNVPRPSASMRDCLDVALFREGRRVWLSRYSARARGILALALVGWMAGLATPALALDLLGSSAGAKEQDPSAGWVTTGSLNTARAGHTATLLPGGKVLVAGGRGSSEILRSTELYDPTSGTWTATGDLSVPRSGHTATLLANGQVLVVGGDVGQASAYSLGMLGTAELYDPGAGTWRRTGSLNMPRAGFSATLLSSGEVLVAGGVDNSDTALTSAELYDPATGTWRYTGSLAGARFAHSATRLLDGRVLVVGGSGDDFLQTAISSAEVYQPALGVWSTADSVGTARQGVTATLLPGGKVLVAGGSAYVPTPSGGYSVSTALTYIYDPVTQWSATGPMNVARSGHTATLLAGGEVLVAGGYGTYSHRGLSSTELYQPATGTWQVASNMSTTRVSHTATRLADGRVLVAGGEFDTNAPLASAELYGPTDPSAVTINAGLTGAWYDPTQSGHGLFVEILPENRFYVAWFAFNPAGTQQVWFSGVGTYSGNIATVTDVEQPTGGHWIPNFNPRQIARNPWGSLKFTFTDCNHGRVDFNSVAGYGSGSMNLTRLTQPAGLSCP